MNFKEIEIKFCEQAAEIARSLASFIECYPMMKTTADRKLCIEQVNTARTSLMSALDDATSVKLAPCEVTTNVRLDIKKALQDMDKCTNCYSHVVGDHCTDCGEPYLRDVQPCTQK